MNISRLSKKIMTKLAFEEHLNMFYASLDISDFYYLLDRKTRKKGYVVKNTLQWYYDNYKMGKLIRLRDNARFEKEYLEFTQP